jgi:hypothetical protein
MCVILQTWCQIQRTPSSLRYLNCRPRHIQCSYSSEYSSSNIQRNVSALLLEMSRQFSEHYTGNLVPKQRTTSSLRNLNCGPGHVQCSYSSAYLGFNIQLNVSALLLEICRQFSEHYTANLVPKQRTTSSLRNLNCGPGHIQCTYSSTYSGFNIQLNVSLPLLEIFRQLNVRYTANMVPNTARTLQSTLSELWSRTYTMCIQFRIFWLQYSTERICDTIRDISIIQCALYCNLGAHTAHILQITPSELWSRSYTV